MYYASSRCKLLFNSTLHSFLISFTKLKISCLVGSGILILLLVFAPIFTWVGLHILINLISSSLSNDIIGSIVRYVSIPLQFFLVKRHYWFNSKICFYPSTSYFIHCFGTFFYMWSMIHN